MKKLILTAVAASLAALLAAPAMADSFGMRVVNDGVSIGIGIGTPPPAPLEYVPPPQPGVVWMPGYWNWDGYRYVWMQGRWVAAAPSPYAWEARPPFWGFGYEHRRHEQEFGRHERREERFERRGGGWRDH